MVAGSEAVQRDADSEDNDEQEARKGRGSHNEGGQTTVSRSIGERMMRSKRNQRQDPKLFRTVPMRVATSTNSAGFGPPSFAMRPRPGTSMLV